MAKLLTDRTGEVAEKGETLATNPDNLSSFAGTHLMEGEN